MGRSNIVGTSLSDTMYDPTSSSTHWVHTVAEVIEAVEALSTMIFTGASGIAMAETGVGLGRLYHFIHWVEGVGAGLAVPIGMGFAIFAAEMTLLGLPYYEAADAVKEESSIRGYCLGVVMGAMRETAPHVISAATTNPVTNYYLPSGAALVKKYFAVGVARGYAEGMSASNSDVDALWKTMVANGGAIISDTDEPNSLWYRAASGRYRKLFIK
jgi:hypothetical protein